MAKRKAKVPAVKDNNTVVRCVTLPVAVPLGTDPTGQPWTWETFKVAMVNAWRLSTDLANWCVRRLFILDDPTQKKTPASIRTWYGYKDAGENYPDVAKWAGAMASFSIVTRTVQRKYIQDRFAVMVRHDQSLLSYHYPQPFPVHNNVWKPSYADGGFPVVKVNIPGVGAVELRLKRKAEFGRQLAMFRQLHDGTAKRGEAALYKNRKGDLLLKLVGHFPRVERETTALHACLLRTDPAALLVAEIDGRLPWIINNDHLNRWQAGHRAYLQRTGEDLKREKRMDASQRRNLDIARRTRCDKHGDRMDTAVHQITAQVARFCERQRVGAVIYDDDNREFIPDGFPWHSLQERLAYKLDGIGVVLLSSKNLEPKERDEWLGNRTLARALALAGTRLIAGVRRTKPHPAVTPNPGGANSSGSRSRPSRKSSPAASASASGKRSRRTPSSAA